MTSFRSPGSQFWKASLHRAWFKVRNTAELQRIDSMFNEIITLSCLHNDYWLRISTAQRERKKKKKKGISVYHVCLANSKSNTKATWAPRCRVEQETGLVAANAGSCSCCSAKSQSFCSVRIPCSQSPLVFRGLHVLLSSGWQGQLEGLCGAAGRWEHTLNQGHWMQPCRQTNVLRRNWEVLWRK